MTPGRGKTCSGRFATGFSFKACSNGSTNTCIFALAPNASRDLVDRIRAARMEYEAASKEVDDAAEIYARALYKAREGGQVDPAIVERLQKAEARMGEVAQIIPPLVEEAKAAGVDTKLLEMYQQQLGLGH